MSHSSIHLLISGRVQGVGFRWFVAREAERLGVAGWVKNLSGGEVEVAAAGEAGQVVKLEEAVRKGPPGARVERVTQLELIAQKDLPKTFEITR